LAVYTVAPPSWLSACVPMPKSRLPVACDTPPTGMSGMVITTPLLSLANSATGLVTCEASGAVEVVQAVPAQE
jgi:hypothetical protein